MMESKYEPLIEKKKKEKEAEEDEEIIVKVIGFGDDDEDDDVEELVLIPLKKTTPLVSLKRQVNDLLAVPSHTYRFFFEGRKIANKDTAESIGLADGDTVYVQLKSEGLFGGGGCALF